MRPHNADMLRDLPGNVARIAAHVGLSHPPEPMSRLFEAATFDSMKANARRFTPSAGQGFWRNDAGFFDSAKANKCQGRLNDAQLAAHDARIDALMGPDDREWLEWGNNAA